MNALRRLYEMGILSQEDMPENDLAALVERMPQPRYDIEPMEMNTMRVESGPEAGKVIPMDFAPQRREAQTGAHKLAPHSVPLIEINGKKARYSADGTYAVSDDGQVHDLQPTKTMKDLQQWFSREKMKRDLSKGDLDSRRGEAELEKTRLEVQNLRAPRPKEAPAGYRWKADGSELEAIPGGPATKGVTPSEDERRSAGLTVRLESALNTMQDNPKDARPEIAPIFARAATMGLPGISDVAANFATSTGRQKVESAQLDALDAALTLATGAAYTKEQLKNLSKSYFPQLGDDEETVKEKRKRFSEIIETARIRAGRAQGDIAKAQGGVSREEAVAEARRRGLIK